MSRFYRPKKTEYVKVNILKCHLFISYFSPRFSQEPLSVDCIWFAVLRLLYCRCYSWISILFYFNHMKYDTIAYLKMNSLYRNATTVHCVSICKRFFKILCKMCVGERMHDRSTKCKIWMRLTDIKDVISECFL